LIHLNSSADQLEKIKLFWARDGAVAGCAIGQLEANKAGAIGPRDSGLLDKNGRV
jgi:hypothetical protein